MNKKRKFEQFLHLTVQKTIAIGCVLIMIVMLVMGHAETRKVTKLADATMSTIKQQCASFNKLVASDRTKSLFRLIELMQILRQDLHEDSSHVNDAYLEQYCDSLRLSGVAVLSGDFKLEASGYTRFFQDENWMASSDGEKIKDILYFPKKMYAERVEADGEYYDICAVARTDADGIIIGYYQQPSALISDTESDLESLLTGLRLERNGHYAIVEDGVVRATSDMIIKDQNVSANPILTGLSSIPKDGHLHIVSVQEEHRYYWGYRSAYEGYILYVYYPISVMLSGPLIGAALFAVLYLFLCMLYFGVRNRALRENKEELEVSNDRLRQTIKTLEALETIYFSLYYVDVKENRYETIYQAPWLVDLIPKIGVYTELKQLFVDKMIVPEFCEEIDHRMSPEFISDSLSSKNITEVRKSFYTDYQSIRGDELRWCRVTATPVDHDEEGKPIHILALVQDINKDKERESNYQNKIIQEAQKAKMANLAKSEFLRRISHDIRTPINGIQGFINLAAKHPDDFEMQAHCRDGASLALHTLLEMVNNVLDMSKLETNDITLEEKPFDLTELLKEINTIIQPQAQAREIHGVNVRHGDVPIPHVIGSPRHLSQILLNLEINAVKYGRPGGYINFYTRMVSADEQTVTYEFICADNGVGMSEEFQEHLFEPFTQETDGARTRYEGTGLGLAIVKKLVDAMHGTVTCESKKNVGTTFRVQLMFLIDQEYQMEQFESDETILQGKHVLLVEDNELNMEIAEYMFLDRGAEVTKAWDGQEAVEKFAESENGYYDVIFMDIMMPKMNGLEAARAIRALERDDAKKIPMIAMSANAFSDDIQQSMDAGMDAHIAKPIDEKKILLACSKLL